MPFSFRPTKRGALRGAAAIVCSTAFGCAALMRPSDDVPPTMSECTQTIAAAERHRDRNSRNDALLFHLRLGTYQQACREFERSTESYENAKRISDDLYTKSISAETVSLLGNDAMRPYPGQNFERAMIRIENALNFAAAGRTESALVEARQVDYFLRELNQAQGGRNVYSEDAFGRYLTGMLHEEAGDVDSARISYILAVEAYQRSQPEDRVGAPPELLSSMLAVAERHSEEAVGEARSLGAERPRALPEGAGEVVIVHQLGRVPDKVEEIITVSWGEGWAYANQYRSSQDDADYQKAKDVAVTLSSRDTFRVAFPIFVDRRYEIDDVEVRVDGHLGIGESRLVSNIGAVAKKDLKDYIHRIRARTIGRAAIYFAAQKFAERQMQDQGNQEAAALIGLAGALRSIVMEHADRRQWDSLPDRIKLRSIILPEGRHTLELSFVGPPGLARSEVVPDVSVRAGRRTFLVVRSAR